MCLSKVIQRNKISNYVKLSKQIFLHLGASLGVKFKVTERNTELNWKIKPKTGPVKLSIFRCSILEGDILANGSEASVANRDQLQGKYCHFLLVLLFSIKMNFYNLIQLSTFQWQLLPNKSQISFRHALAISLGRISNLLFARYFDLHNPLKSQCPILLRSGASNVTQGLNSYSINSLYQIALVC